MSPLLLADIETGGILGLLVLILDIFAVASVLIGRGSVMHKLIWTLLILFLPVLGMILYFIFGRNATDA